MSDKNQPGMEKEIEELKKMISVVDRHLRLSSNNKFSVRTVIECQLVIMQAMVEIMEHLNQTK